MDPYLNGESDTGRKGRDRLLQKLYVPEECMGPLATGFRYWAGNHQDGATSEVAVILVRVHQQGRLRSMEAVDGKREGAPMARKAGCRLLREPDISGGQRYLSTRFVVTLDPCTET